jgi:hypothetical protein
MKEPYVYYYPEVTDLASCSSEAWRQKPGEVIGGVHRTPANRGNTSHAGRCLEA